MYECFSLVLAVTHACNLRCAYCYTGTKSDRTMRPEIGEAAIDRAIRSIHPGGTLELGFFGGEPLLEAPLVGRFIHHARSKAAAAGIRLYVHLTTNGTVHDGPAWEVMVRPEMELSVSHDGLPEIHDRHRRTADGRGTSDGVLETIGRLLDAGRDVHAVMVVRPDTVTALAEGILFLRRRGIRYVVLSLDLWAPWTPADAQRLQEALARSAEVWRTGLPHFGVSWFDEKAGRLAGLPGGMTARCGFGDGEIAVAASGNLYPCERLIGPDAPDQPLRLSGHATAGEDFGPAAAPPRGAASCSACAIEPTCSTTCRCSNYVRTGDVSRPDGLLCLLDRTCHQETARVLSKEQTVFAETPFLYPGADGRWRPAPQPARGGVS